MPVRIGLSKFLGSVRTQVLSLATPDFYQLSQPISWMEGLSRQGQRRNNTTAAASTINKVGGRGASKTDLVALDQTTAIYFTPW